MRKILLCSVAALFSITVPAAFAQDRTNRQAPQRTVPAQTLPTFQAENQAGNFTRITFPGTTGDKISLFGNRISQPNMYGFGVESNTLTYKSANTHRWYVNGSSRMSLTGDILNVEKIVAPEQLGDKISLFGSRLGQANMYGLGVASNTLYFKSANTHKWFVNNQPTMALVGGRLGIGTQSPNHELIVQGNDPVMQIRDDAQDNSANAARLELLENAGGSFDGGAYFWWNGDTNRLLIGTKNQGNNTNLLVLDRASNSVGIGTQNPGSYRLAVNGKVRAKEIVVETGWSDYVFEDGYDLKSLQEVKAFISENGHLPDVPSAEEIAENGVSLGESQSTLLRKIEELTLHIIALEERLAEVEAVQ